MSQIGALGAGLTFLAAVPGPVQELLGGSALAATAELSAENLRTYVAAVEAVCSFDGKTPPPTVIDGQPQPSAGEVGQRFAADYRTQYAGFRQTADVVLPVAEQGPRTPPPVGAVSVADLAAYGGRPFSQLDVPLRLRFLRSWLTDHDETPLDPGYVALGITDVGSLHRAVAVAAIQLSVLHYYWDRRTWAPVGWTGPWLGRRHEREELPFSHAGHEVYTVDMGVDRGRSKWGL